MSEVMSEVSEHDLSQREPRRQRPVASMSLSERRTLPGSHMPMLIRLFVASIVVALALMVLIPSVGHAADRININKADMTALQTLPGIGEKRARAIMDYRRKNGGFADKRDLLQVPGIGDAILKGINSRIVVSGGVSKVKSAASTTGSSSAGNKKTASKPADNNSKIGGKAKKSAKKDTGKSRAAKKSAPKKDKKPAKKSDKKSKKSAGNSSPKSDSKKKKKAKKKKSS